MWSVARAVALAQGRGQQSNKPRNTPGERTANCDNKGKRISRRLAARRRARRVALGVRPRVRTWCAPPAPARGCAGGGAATEEKTRDKDDKRRRDERRTKEENSRAEGARTMSVPIGRLILSSSLVDPRAPLPRPAPHADGRWAGCAHGASSVWFADSRIDDNTLWRATVPFHLSSCLFCSLTSTMRGFRKLGRCAAFPAGTHHVRTRLLFRIFPASPCPIHPLALAPEPPHAKESHSCQRKLEKAVELYTMLLMITATTLMIIVTRRTPPPEEAASGGSDRGRP